MGEVQPIPSSGSSAKPEAQSATINPPMRAAIKAAKSNPKAKKPATKPTKILPTDRIAFPKQLDILRAYAAINSSGGKVVSNKEVAGMLKIQPSTVSLANPFMVSVGLLEKAEGGYTPGADVTAFLRAYEWNPETAANKLAPALRNSWFAQIVLPLVSFSTISEREAIEKLGQACSAGPDYKAQIRYLLDYLNAAGLIERDGGQVKSVKSSNTAEPAPPANSSPGQSQHRKEPEKVDPPESARIATAFAQSPEGVVQFHISIRVGMGEFAGWDPERIAAFFSGIAKVLAAKADVEKKA